MIDVIGIGSSVYDILMKTNGFPKEDTKMQGTETLIQGGGPCATALAAMSRLGATTAYMGTMGDDIFGHFMADDLARYNVNTNYIRFQKDCISFHAVVILNEKTSSRTCVWNKGTVLMPKIEDIDETAIKVAKVLHLDGHQLDAAVYAAKLARANGVKVSLDAGGIYPGIERLLPLIDFLIPSEEFALKISGEKEPETAAKKLFNLYHPEIFIMTQGIRGGFIYDGREMTRYPAFPVDAVDTNGSGDVFHGAFIAAYINGMPFISCANFASAVSALKCTGFGARRSVPTYEHTLEFLMERGVAV